MNTKDVRRAAVAIGTQIENKQLRSVALGIVAAASLCAASSVEAQTTAHSLTVARWVDDGTGGGGVSTTFSDSDADTMFAAANAVVTLADQAGDVACNHSITRAGAVAEVHGNQSDGDINSAMEFDYVNSGAAFVKVVPQISFCAGAFMTGIGGCTAQGGFNSMVLAEWAVKGHPATGVVAAHEFGHAVNLDHEEFQINNFMIAESTPEHRNVNAVQCPSLQSNAVDTNGPGFAAPMPKGETSLAPRATYMIDLSADKPTIEELAGSVFLHVPLYLEGQRDSSDLQALLNMLRSEPPAVYQPTIIMLIAVLSGERAEDEAASLIEFADAHYGTIASRIAIESLGHLAERGSNLALNRLFDYVSVSNAYDASAAVVGLGLSGRAEAHAVLQQLLATATTVSRYAPSAAKVDSIAPKATYALGAPSLLERETVVSAIVANETIAASGREGYYRR